MPEFDVDLSRTFYANVRVEADNEEQAVEIAMDNADFNITNEDDWEIDEIEQLEDEADPDDDSDSRDGTVEED